MIRGRKLVARVALAAAVVFSAAIISFTNQTPVNASEGTPATTYCQCENTYSDGSVKTEQGSDAMIFGDSNSCYCGGPKGVIRIGIDIFTGFIAVAGTIGIVIAGVMYMTARDSEEQVVKAKKRLVNVIIGIVCFALLDVVANFILPTGLTDNEPTITSSVSMRIDRPVETAMTPRKKKATPTALVNPNTKEPTKHKYQKPSGAKGTGNNNGGSNNSGNKKTNGTCKDGAKVTKTVTYRKQFLDKNGLIQWKGGNTSCKSKRWKKNHNIGCSACPMIATLNAVNQVTGCNYTQQNFADKMKSHTKNWTKRKGLFQNNAAWSNTGYPIVYYYASAYGVKYKQFYSNKRAKAKAALQKGHAVVVSGPTSKGSDKIYGSNGHFVLFAEYNASNDKVKIVNASGANSSTFVKWYSWDKAVKYAYRFIEIWK